LTGVPVLLNTSFNENEPIVPDACPGDRLLLRTQMDLLSIGGSYCARENVHLGKSAAFAELQTG